MRYFQKAFRRTDIKVLYSKGFSPHMIMSFAQPLGVGVESDGEYFDVEVDDSEDVSLFKDKLNVEMAEGVAILEAVVLPEKTQNAMASVAAAGYELNFYKESPLSEALINKYTSCDKAEYVKTTKTGEHVINVKNFVFDLKLIDNNTLYLLCDASSSGNLKPSTFVEALLKLENMDSSLYPFHILRKDTYKRNEKDALVPLSQF